MSRPRLIYPNFRVGEPRRRPDRPRKRAVTLVLSQAAYDALMSLAGGEEAALPRLLLEATETVHGLESGDLTDGLPKS